MTAETRRQTVTLFNLNWEFAQHKLTFSPLYTIANDHESATNIDLGLQMSFSE